MNWYQLAINEVLAHQHTSLQGLSGKEAAKRLGTYGYNIITEGKKNSAIKLFFRQFYDFMILVLIIAAIISGITGGITDTIIILSIVILNATLGFVQEYRAEKAIQLLKQMAVPHVSTLRDGAVVYIAAQELVPGDIVLLEAGNTVPADLRIIETHALRLDESSITGESLPADKIIAAIYEQHLPVNDQSNMAFTGTHVVYGRGKGMVTATGMHTETGKIAAMLQVAETKTPLQQQMTSFGKKLSWIVIGICTVLFFMGLLRGEQPASMFLVAVSLAVAAIPEALPALVTIALARGAGRLVRKNALIRKLPAVETLGAVSIICSDKTGTLTQNKMEVVHVSHEPAAISLHQHLSLLECSMAVNNDVHATVEGTWSGDPTEIALVNYICKQYPDLLLKEIQETFPRIGEIPFDADRKCMTTIHRWNGRYIAISKGAAESIAMMLPAESDKDHFLREERKLAAAGMRVLAFAYKILAESPQNTSNSVIESNMVFSGLVAMMDPPREEVKKAIRDCITAGIRPVMITGDHPETAAAVARATGMMQEKGMVITGRQLSTMTQNDLEAQIGNISVFARISPGQKLDIIRTLQNRNHFVAMTGDGINDAPSLKKANIGIAMGITGTDISKEAAHMILLDDNFATIVKAIKEGRRINDNIRRFIRYIMTCNSAEILVIFLAPLLGLPLPLLPVQLLWINLITDGLPGLALASEKAEKNIMQRPPAPKGESLFAGGTSLHIIWVGILMAAITLGTQAVTINNDGNHWQTMTFMVLSLSQLGHVFAIRSNHEPIYKKGIFSNLPLLFTLLLTFVLQVAILYIPFANRALSIQPLTFPELLACIGIASVIFHAVELEKWLRRKFA